MDLTQTYSMTIAALGAMAALMFIQLLIADVIGIRLNHIPGSQVATDHKSILFRVSRTAANTCESIGIFILAVLFCMLSGADPTNTAYTAWAFICARLLYAICYYLNLQLFRSIMFGMALISLASLIVTGGAVWFR